MFVFVCTPIQAGKYMIDFDATHCTPLPPMLFMMPWSVEDDTFNAGLDWVKSRHTLRIGLRVTVKRTQNINKYLQKTSMSYYYC